MRGWLGVSVLVLLWGAATASAQRTGAAPEPESDGDVGAREASEPPPLVAVVEVWGPSAQANVVRRALSSRLGRRVVPTPPEGATGSATLVTILVSAQRGAVTVRTAEGRSESRTVRPEGRTRDATWIVPHAIALLAAVGLGPPPEPAREAAAPPGAEGSPAPGTASAAAADAASSSPPASTVGGSSTSSDSASPATEEAASPERSDAAAEGSRSEAEDASASRAAPPARPAVPEPPEHAGGLEHADGLTAPQPGR